MPFISSSSSASARAAVPRFGGMFVGGISIGGMTFDFRIRKVPELPSDVAKYEGGSSVSLADCCAAGSSLGLAGDSTETTDFGVLLCRRLRQHAIVRASTSTMVPAAATMTIVAMSSTPEMVASDSVSVISAPDGLAGGGCASNDGGGGGGSGGRGGLKGGDGGDGGNGGVGSSR